jgi:hypothetical protein
MRVEGGSLRFYIGNSETDLMHAGLIPQIHRMTVAFLGNDQLCILAIRQRDGHDSGAHHGAIRSQNILRSGTTDTVFVLNGFGRVLGTPPSQSSAKRLQAEDLR